jgi:hypothetical protein
MSSYKDLLRERLERSGWELSSTDPDGIDWWAAELWHIRSMRQAWGLELVLSFLVDPMEQSGRSKPHIWAISADPHVPSDRLRAGQGVALLTMSKGHFETRLQDFVEALEAYRNARQNA